MNECIMSYYDCYKLFCLQRFLQSLAGNNNTLNKNDKNAAAAGVTTSIPVISTSSSTTTVSVGIVVPTDATPSVATTQGATSSTALIKVEPKFWQLWDRLIYAITILQLERPSDWLASVQ